MGIRKKPIVKLSFALIISIASLIIAKEAFCCALTAFPSMGCLGGPGDTILVEFTATCEAYWGEPPECINIYPGDGGGPLVACRQPDGTYEAYYEYCSPGQFIAWTDCPGCDPVPSADVSIYEMRITECDSTWIPKGASESNVTTFTATIYPQEITDCIEFGMFEVSQDAGYCTNAGNFETPDYDLKFAPEDNPGFSVDELIATTIDRVNSATVTVRSYDYGSYGEIEASFTYCTAHVVGGFLLFAQIPDDEDNDGIADEWEKQ